MKRCIVIRFYCFLFVFFITKLTSAQQKAEFTGILSSWANVVSRFGAKGNGIQDDTKYLQAAIDSLSVPTLNFNKGDKAYTVIYLPRGTYKISNTLLLMGKIGFSIIGEDPKNTIIEWAGNQSDTMLWANGSGYFRLSRIQFKTSERSDISAIGIHWKDNIKNKQVRSVASVNIEISDCYFKDVAVGISGGYKWNDSEIKIARCVFDNCTKAGVNISGHNALDYWIWDSRFLNCTIGVNCTRGNFHLYNSYFKKSILSDIANDQGYYNSVRGCFSEGSKAFSRDRNSSSNSFKRIFQDNIVKKPTFLPILYYHIGKPTFYGNHFDRSDSAISNFTKNKKGAGKEDPNFLPAVLSYTSWAKANFSVLSINNIYNYKNPFNIKSQSPKIIYSIADTYGQIIEQNGEAFTQSMPSTPLYVRRKIFTVPKEASSEIIQAIVNEASYLKGDRPIIHFPYGNYILNKTIIIPPGSDMKIMGDGYRYSTVISPRKENFRGNCLFKIMGPSFIEIENLQFGTSGSRKIRGLEFFNIDQQQSRLITDQIYTISDTAIFLNRLNYLYVEKNNSFFSDGNIVHGGKIQKAGKGTLEMNCFGGQYKGVELRNNARFISKDCWWEGKSRIPIQLEGDGYFTIDGSKLAPNNSDSSTAIKIGKFKGSVSLLNMYVQGSINIESDNSNLDILIWNVNFWHLTNLDKLVPDNFSGRIALAGLTSQCFDKNNPACKLTKSYDDNFVNIKDKDKYLHELTSQTRKSRPVKILNDSGNSSQISISRVLFDSFSLAIYIDGE